MIVASLFAGVGGSSLGYRAAGFDVRYACENDPWAAETYELNHGLPVDRRSVEVVSGDHILAACGGRVDILDGSPPCPPWTTMPQPHPRRMLDDPRGELIWEYARLVDEVRPRVFALENVPGLTRDEAQSHLRELLQALARAGDGYAVAYSHPPLDASWHGTAQARPRVLLLGFQLDLGIDPAAAFPQPYARRRVIRDVLPDAAGLLLEPAPGIGRTAGIRRRRTWPDCEPAPTITASGLTICHRNYAKVELRNGAVRRMSIQDVLALSGFPSDFAFHTDSVERQWRALGNSVPPPLAEAWARSIVAALSNHVVANSS